MKFKFFGHIAKRLDKKAKVYSKINDAHLIGSK